MQISYNNLVKILERKPSPIYYHKYINNDNSIKLWYGEDSDRNRTKNLFIKIKVPVDKIKIGNRVVNN